MYLSKTNSNLKHVKFPFKNQETLLFIPFFRCKGIGIKGKAKRTGEKVFLAMRKRKIRVSFYSARSGLMTSVIAYAVVMVTWCETKFSSVKGTQMGWALVPEETKMRRIFQAYE